MKDLPEMDLYVYPSVLRLLVFGVISVIFSYVGWLMASEDEPLVGWIIILFFVPMSVFFFLMAFRGKRPILAVGHQGIWVSPLTIMNLFKKPDGYLIPWDFVEGIEIVEQSYRLITFTYIRLWLNEDAPIPQSIFMGFYGDSLCPAGITKSREGFGCSQKIP
ncbi:MAG: hypothetical protein ABIL16_04515 [candidate division WOR-3 bacterium]